MSFRASSFLLASALISLSSATTSLSPDQDIVLPSSSSATNPLALLGGNSPYFAGPNVNNIANVVPDDCYVDQVAYVVRHGSRFPDSGAYKEWTTLYSKIQAATFTAKGELEFLSSWKPVLTNPTLQIAQESPTGWKEAFDLGYRLRTKYADLYAEGTPFFSWTNLYPRVVQTSQNFVRGFLGNKASTLGNVVTINSTGSPLALFDSLSPSDQCPNYKDGNGGTEATDWDALYLPPITARLNALLSGNLNLTTSDISIFPYLCGFESQITGTLSPFCSTFTDAELAAYEYRQDLRYYYGMGPGTDLPSKMMLPFLSALTSLLASGPGTQGTLANGTAFELPSILTAFLNDGQLTQLTAALGIFDDEPALSGTKLAVDRKYISGHFVSMRGTVAFERFTCLPSTHRRDISNNNNNNIDNQPNPKHTTLTTSTSAAPTCTPTKSFCAHDNCERALAHASLLASPFCASYTAPHARPTPLPAYISPCGGDAVRISSACGCAFPTATATACSTSTTSTSTSATPTPTPTNPATHNTTYIRILLNDAVYPVAGCASGPGRSCEMSQYAALVADKVEAAGDLVSRCNVTAAGGLGVLKGASFFTDLGLGWVDVVGA